ncbi:myeloid cell nuclear differentiation antigen-like protein isoform X1 [Meriones unguiculatus]|uniref:myeloid cell nuclear differentiation antigen-like protein isoform X1 n=1 Tax=Meriones unguiculatus TaxID=10047 RepID=UPI00293E64EC|nr:myeloid cell nuclear differentiation antigen-like protein isoform X1 [Meriones unguiculatus]
MASEFKKIVLLKGLQVMEDYQFRAIKSLLRKELKLTKKMQDEYDRIQMADLMEDKFTKDAGLAKLIELCKDVEELKEIAEKLKTEKEKVKNQKGKKGKSAAKKRKQDESSSLQTFSTSNESNSSKNKIEQPRKTEAGKKRKLTQDQTQLPEPSESNTQKDEGCFQTPHKPPPIPSGSSSSKKSQTPNPSTSRGDVLQMDPMTVMVLNSTHPFEYESSEHGRKTMFHAKVATAKQYYHVKVFNVSLREKFTKNNFIIISNFVKGREILEINENSFVVEAGPDLKFEVPNSIIKRANETPKIRHIEKGASGALFYGLFTLIKKTVKVRNTIYEIKDNEEKHIEVVGNGKCYNINCEEGDKLRLYCFQLRTIEKQPKLVSGDHSFIEVTKCKKKKEIPTAHSSTNDEKQDNMQHQFCYFKVETPNKF